MTSRTQPESVTPKIDSVALGRLVAEVSTPGRPISVTGYNRSYNRHNR